MHGHNTYMRRALALARLGGGAVAPNPMVGAVLVWQGRILAEGWHQAFGGSHAEVACLRSFGDDPLPEDTILYVSLEPCSHQGKTPPCADMLIERGVKHVVIAQEDPFPEVSGRGIVRLREAGVKVTLGVAEDEARWSNRRFLTSVEQGRPYIILKWARSADGFLDRGPRADRGVQRISTPATDVLVHQWRSDEQAILVGGRTVMHDDPSLTVRHVPGRSPLRVILDRTAITPDRSKVYDGSTPTLLFTATPRPALPVEQSTAGLDGDPLALVLAELHRRRVRSVLVEGGARLLRAFIERGSWDEARVIHGTPIFGHGTPAPDLSTPAFRYIEHDTDRIAFHVNNASPAIRREPDPAWPW